MRGEGHGRTSRTIGYGRTALLSVAGAALVAMIMVGSAAAASTTTVLTPKYSGLVAPENEVFANGCQSSAKEIVKANFHLKTGLGVLSDTGKAGNCGKKAPKGFSFYNSAGTDTGFEVLVKLPKISAATTNVSANLGGKYSWTASVTSGGKTGACPQHLENEFYNYTEWEWNSFSNFAYQDQYEVNGVWNNNSYNVASVPSPFNLNNTTYYYHDEGNETYNSVSCYASAFGDVDMYAYLCDTDTGYCYYYTGTDASTYADFGVNLDNETDFSTTGYTYDYWDEGFGSNTSYPAYSDNQSGTSWYEYCSSPCVSSSGSSPTNTSQTVSSTTSLTGSSFWWNSVGGSPFNASNHYYLELNFFGYFDAENENWAHGDSAFAINMATAGNGVKLNSISIV